MKIVIPMYAVNAGLLSLWLGIRTKMCHRKPHIHHSYAALKREI